jgi:IS605 OrfB family transposase
MMRTWQARLAIDVSATSLLDAYAAIHGQAERCLFAEMYAGKKTKNSLKQEYQKRFGLTARQFNAVRIGLEGKIRSIQARRPDLIKALAQRTAKAKSVIADLRAKTGGTPAQKVRRANAIHQKVRRLANLEHRLQAMQADQQAGKIRLCFGSRKLFHAQFALEENGYTDHAAWQSDWRAARSSEFMIVGSKDETAGNQSCQARLIADDRFTLRLRLPNAMGAAGKSLDFHVHLPYGGDRLAEALTLGRAITYRFVRDAAGWRVFISTDLVARAATSSKQLGMIGLDINADHLAVSELDRHGNIIDSRRIPLHTYGKSQAQALAAIGDAVKAVIALAVAGGKPIGIEKLEFSKKKSVLEGEKPRYKRMLSSFAYSRIIQTINARAFDAGIEVMAVNPACTSIIGRHKFAGRYGISIHQAAAAAIGRRAQNLSEQPNRRMATHVTFALPVRNRAKQVWVFWRHVARMEAAHAARLRLIRRKAGQSLAAGNAGKAIYPRFAGGTPARESLRRLFA